MKSQPRPLGHWLNNSVKLKRLLENCQQHSDLLALVKSRLPDPLCEHCCAASLNDAELVLAIDSPVWSGRLRFMQGNLTQQLGQVGIRITSMKVNTIPLNQPAKVASRPHQSPLSDENARMIGEISASIENPDLKAALNRLAKHQQE